MTLALDTLEASEELTQAGFTKDQAKALVKAISSSGDSLVTNEKLDATVNNLKVQLIIWMVGLQIATISFLAATLG